MDPQRILAKSDLSNNKCLQSAVTCIKLFCLRYVAAGTKAGSVVVLSVIGKQVFFNHEEHVGSPVLSSLESGQPTALQWCRQRTSGRTGHIRPLPACNLL